MPSAALRSRLEGRRSRGVQRLQPPNGEATNPVVPRPTPVVLLPRISSTERRATVVKVSAQRTYPGGDGPPFRDKAERVTERPRPRRVHQPGLSGRPWRACGRRGASGGSWGGAGRRPPSSGAAPRALRGAPGPGATAGASASSGAARSLGLRSRNILKNARSRARSSRSSSRGAGSGSRWLIGGGAGRRFSIGFATTAAGAAPRFHKAVPRPLQAAHAGGLVTPQQREGAARLIDLDAHLGGGAFGLVEVAKGFIDKMFQTLDLPAHERGG